MRVWLPRVRVRLWWLMAAVAVVGIALGGWEMCLRANRFRDLASHHSLLRLVHQDQRRLYDPEIGRNRYRSILTPRAQYHVEMSRKYERAARSPWLPVGPDPPPPE